MMLLAADQLAGLLEDGGRARARPASRRPGRRPDWPSARWWRRSRRRSCRRPVRRRPSSRAARRRNCRTARSTHARPARDGRRRAAALLDHQRLAPAGRTGGRRSASSRRSKLSQPSETSSTAPTLGCVQSRSHDPVGIGVGIAAGKADQVHAAARGRARRSRGPRDGRTRPGRPRRHSCGCPCGHPHEEKLAKLWFPGNL